VDTHLAEGDLARAWNDMVSADMKPPPDVPRASLPLEQGGFVLNKGCSYK